MKAETFQGDVETFAYALYVTRGKYLRIVFCVCVFQVPGRFSGRPHAHPELLVPSL